MEGPPVGCQTNGGWFISHQVRAQKSLTKHDVTLVLAFVACFTRSDAYTAADDIACIGLMLTAVQERVNERDLANWRKLQTVINKTLKLIPISRTMIHCKAVPTRRRRAYNTGEPPALYSPVERAFASGSERLGRDPP